MTNNEIKQQQDQKQQKPNDLINLIQKIDPQVLSMNNQQLRNHIQAIKDQLQFQKRELESVKQEIKYQKDRENEVKKRVDQSKILPMIICNVSELLTIKEEETGQEMKSVVIKAPGRQSMFCQTSGLVPYEELKPNDLIAANRETYLIYERLPQFYDARVKQMLVADKPKDTFADVGGMDLILKQVDEAVLLPFKRPDLFEQIGIQPSKGLLLYGPPGVGKTLIARCIANACDCIFLSLCATQLIQMYIGDGSQMLQELFDLAKEYVEKDTINGVAQNSPKEKLRGAIIYIDEIDAIGTRRSEGDQNSGKETARTLMLLLNLMDGFISNSRIKVIASTNRVEQLDPALVRSNRFDRKIECQLPNLQGRVKILEIHSKKMKVSPEVQLVEVAKSCEDFSGAQLKQVCVEAGMTCVRRGGREIEVRDFVQGVSMVRNRQVNVEGYL